MFDIPLALLEGAFSSCQQMIISSIGSAGLSVPKCGLATVCDCLEKIVFKSAVFAL